MSLGVPRLEGTKIVIPQPALIRNPANRPERRQKTRRTYARKTDMMLNPMMPEEVAVKRIPMQLSNGLKELFAFREVSFPRHRNLRCIQVDCIL